MTVQMLAGYDAALVIEFLHEQGLARADGVLVSINKQRTTESNRETLARWCQQDIVPLAKLDAFFLKYGLMLFELEQFASVLAFRKYVEQWAEEHHGHTGFVDPLDVAA